MNPTPCDHTGGTGLCPECRADHDTDPQAYEEYGAHPRGRENWRLLQEAMAAREPAKPVPPEAVIPF